VVPAFERFLAAFPTVQALAAAPQADDLVAWDGLGYNRRALRLSVAGRAVVLEHRGEVPSDVTLLEGLPGVGPYTAAAVAALAFGRPVVAMDTNVRRVVARAELGVDPVEATPAAIRQAAERALDRTDPAAWNQAVMDVGREHCRPAPRCTGCPLARSCRFLRRGARSSPPSRRSKPFVGSSRQVRGAVLSELRHHRTSTLAGLVARTGFDATAIGTAVRAMHHEGLVHAGPRALLGAPNGRIRLPRV
jgi:A/G-specific adenine glycosylase